MKKTNFRLSEEQEKDLLEYIQKRLPELQKDCDERIASDQLSWGIYANDRADREGADNIFSQSNVPVPLTSLIVDHFLARAEDDITGTSPYFRFQAQGPQDEELVEQFDRYFQWKLETKGKVRERLEECYLHLFLQRSAIFKAVYDEQVSIWYDFERLALFDLATEEFIQDFEGNPILEGDAQFEPSIDPETGEQALVLVTDPSIILVPGRQEFRPYPKGVPTELIKYKGPRSVIVDSDRFLCPSSVEHVEDADIVVEKYDKALRWVQEMFVDREWYSFADYLKDIRKDANKRTETQVNKDSKEDLTFDSEENPQIEILEIWLKRDVLKTGIPQEFVVFYDSENEKIIFNEYLAKVTPDNRLPYSTISIGKEKNRWWGPSLPEKIRVFQEYVDRQFNCQSYRNELAANPIIGVNPQAVQDEPDDVELYAGKVFELKDQYGMEDFLTYAALPNIDQKTQELIDFVFGMVQLWLGVSNLAQGDYQALTPANTATGVEATLREASKIGRRWMRRIVRGFEDHLTKLVKVAMATLDEPEVFQYMEGEVSAFGTMTPDMVKNLEMDAKVILSQEQSQRAIEKANLAIEVQGRYFQYQPEMRPWVRPLMEKILGALGYENIDRILPDEAPSDPQSDAELMKLMSDAQGGGGGGGAAPAAKNDQISGAVQAAGNSNQQGQNQYQQSTGT